MVVIAARSFSDNFGAVPTCAHRADFVVFGATSPPQVSEEFDTKLRTNGHADDALHSRP